MTRKIKLLIKISCQCYLYTVNRRGQGKIKSGDINKQRMKCQFYNENFNEITRVSDESGNIFLSFLQQDQKLIFCVSKSHSLTLATLFNVALTELHLTQRQKEIQILYFVLLSDFSFEEKESSFRLQWISNKTLQNFVVHIKFCVEGI